MTTSPRLAQHHATRCSDVALTLLHIQVQALRPNNDTSLHNNPPSPPQPLNAYALLPSLACEVC